MAKKKKLLTKFVCVECKRINYYKVKSKKAGSKKLELKKFCKNCKKHTLHKETR